MKQDAKTTKTVIISQTKIPTEMGTNVMNFKAPAFNLGSINGNFKLIILRIIQM